jgi:hypothetical protein
MSFGRNPHVAKAEAAEQKARSATDDAAYELAWREAARMWERAAEREKDEKRRKQYVDRAESARASADEPREVREPQGAEPEASDEDFEEAVTSKDTRLLN